MATTVSLSLSSITDDAYCQSRKKLKSETIAHYAERMKEGDEFPPIIVYESDEGRFLSEGFHRFNAAKSVGLKEIDCEVRQGTRDDAAWNALPSNEQHGERSDPEDRQYAIEKALKHPKWSQMSDRAIAGHVRCSPTTVGKVRNQLSTVDSSKSEVSDPPKDDKPKTRTGRDGRSRRAPDPPPAKPETSSNGKAKDPPKQAPEAPAVKDGLGNPVDEKYREAFEDGRFEEFRQAIVNLSHLVDKMTKDRWCGHLHAQSIKADLNNAKRAVVTAKPYAVCGYCKGKGCNACRMSGIVSKLIWESTPEEKK